MAPYKQVKLPKPGPNALAIITDAVRDGVVTVEKQQQGISANKSVSNGYLTRDKKDGRTYYPTDRAREMLAMLEGIAEPGDMPERETETAVVPVADASGLVATVERARALLDDGDIINARIVASVAYNQAKTAAQFAEQIGATEKLIAKARRMSDVGVLLPSSAEPFEKALAAGMSDDLPIPYAVLMDPYQTPARFLPWLAVHHSVDLWFDDWTEERKREMIAQCAGVSTHYPASPLGAQKGTLAGLKRYLAFVDAEIVDRIAHPNRFTFGRAVIGRTPIAHQAFVAHYLVRITLTAPKNRFQIGRSAFGRAAMTAINLEPIRRAKRAMTTAKTPETLYSVSFAWRRGITFNDNIFIDGSHAIGGYMDRKRLD